MFLICGCFRHRTAVLRNLAYQSLVQGYISYDELMQLVSHLPTSDLSDRPIFNTQIQRHRAFITGACVHSGTAAIMSNFNTYPWVTRLLCSIGRQQAPTLWYSSIAINLNCQSAMHRDSNNHSFLPSAVIPASLFTGGQLWVENLSGSNCERRCFRANFPCVTFQSRSTCHCLGLGIDYLAERLPFSRRRLDITPTLRNPRTLESPASGPLHVAFDDQG